MHFIFRNLKLLLKIAGQSKVSVCANSLNWFAVSVLGQANFHFGRVFSWGICCVISKKKKLISLIFRNASFGFSHLWANQFINILNLEKTSCFRRHLLWYCKILSCKAASSGYQRNCSFFISHSGGSWKDWTLCLSWGWSITAAPSCLNWKLHQSARTQPSHQPVGKKTPEPAVTWTSHV